MDLRERLQRAGLDPANLPTPREAFAALHRAEGLRATLLDRYQLEEMTAGPPDAERKNELWREVALLRDPATEILGSPSGDQIEIVDYQEEWPLRFAKWEQRLRLVLPPEVGIHHIGSTSVPGLAAKPVVDIMVTVPDIDDESSYVLQIEGTGILLRSRESDHRYFRPPPEAMRLVQIHVCQTGSTWEHNHLRFRDRLRAEPDLAARYEKLKRRLAVEHRDDRLAYNEAKTDFILDAI